MAKSALRPVEIAQLWRGASSQAPWKRLEGQVSDSLNIRHDIARGAIKRNPTTLIRDLERSEHRDKNGNPYPGQTPGPLDPDGKWFFTSIRNILVAIGRDSQPGIGAIPGVPQIHAWDDDGTPIPIVDYQKTIVQVTADFDFIPADPASQLRVAVSQDTILVGKTTVQLNTQRAWSFRQSYNYIKHGNENPPSILGGFGDPLAGDGFTNTVFDPQADPPTPGADVFESLDQANDAIPAPNDGTVIRTRFDFELDPAGWYIAFDGDAYPRRGTDAGQDPDSVAINEADEMFPRHGRWFRVPDGRGPATGDQSGNDVGDANNGQQVARPHFERWPQRLLYDDTQNVLYWSRGPWKHRLSGNPASNPKPSLTLQQCQGLTFFQNRLTVSSQGSIIGSRAGDYFNFYLNNVNGIGDDDRFDQFISFGNVGDVIRQAECGNRLILLCESAQVEFGSGDESLTNLNGRQRLLTRFKTKNIRPAEGPGVVTILDQYLNVHQYTFMSPEVGVAYTGRLNIHDRDRWFRRDPAAVFAIDRLTYVPEVDGDTMTHEIFLIEGSEIQSAWSRFETVGTIKYVDEWRQAHRWITQDDVGYTLVHYVHEDVQPPDDAQFWPSIDRLERVSGTYDAFNNLTEFQHTNRMGTVEASRLVLMGDDELHEILKPTSVDPAGVLYFVGDHTTDGTNDKDPYLGFTYTGQLDLTKLFAGLSAGIVTISRVFVFHENSTDYTAGVRLPDGTEETSEWQGDVTGVTILGRPKNQTFFSDHTLLGDARRCELFLRHTGAGRVTWSGLQYWVDLSGVGE
jgi:hypothetical protein